MIWKALVHLGDCCLRDHGVERTGGFAVSAFGCLGWPPAFGKPALARALQTNKAKCCLDETTECQEQNNISKKK